ncbi:hypothetical protein QQ045_011859 [Rhodiola kirilowii]
MLHFWWDKKESGKGINRINQATLQKKKCEGGLGLKDLLIFNEAMLLKICRRMAKQPDLLLSRTLLAKYCGGGNIFDVRLGSNPSHNWRGVMKSMDFFLKGLWWDEEKRTFRWKLSSTGDYTVRSTYEGLKYCSSNYSVEQAEQSNKSSLWKFWRKLWSTNIPNKIKIFCWRFFHNGLQDVVNLWRRGVITDRNCKICGVQGQTALHVVADCWWAKALLSKFYLFFPHCQAELGSSADWLWWCTLNLSDEDRRKLFIVMWLCWRNRNNVWHDKEGWNISQASIIGKSMLRLSQCRSSDSSTSEANFSSIWSPPPQGVIKINIDGAWEVNPRRAVLGIVARDHLGVVLWLKAMHGMKGMCSSEVEGLAFLQALNLALSLEVKEAFFETDSLEVYRVVSSGVGVVEWCESWLEEVTDILRLKPGWRLRSISREANTAADWLASKAMSSSWSWESLEAIPWFPSLSL